MCIQDEREEKVDCKAEEDGGEESEVKDAKEDGGEESEVKKVKEVAGLEGEDEKEKEKNSEMEKTVKIDESVNVAVSGNALIVTIEVPSAFKKDFKVQIEDGKVVVEVSTKGDALPFVSKINEKASMKEWASFYNLLEKANLSVSSFDLILKAVGVAKKMKEKGGTETISTIVGSIINSIPDDEEEGKGGVSPKKRKKPCPRYEQLQKYC